MNFRVVTIRGWGWLATSILCLVLGLLFGWIELIGLAVAGLVTFGSATVYGLFKHSHEVSFHLAHSRVVVGEEAEILLTVTNPTNHALPGLDVFVKVGEAELFSRIPRLTRLSSENIQLPIPTQHRGQLEVGPARIVRADPLGLISREVITGEKKILYIHPHTISLMSMSTGFVRDLEGTPTTDLTDNDLSFHALREYLPGDDRRNIHWKSSAKTGEFMVRQFEQTRRSHLMITLDTHAESYASDEEFELAVSVAASLGVRALRDTRDVSMLVPSTSKPAAIGRLGALREAARQKLLSRNAELGRRGSRVIQLTTASSERMLDELSGVVLDSSSPHLVELARLASLQAADVSVAFVVTSAGAQAREIHAASVVFPAGVEVVVISCAPESTPAMRRLGRLSVLNIGRLDDVKQLLAKKSVAA